MRLVVKIGWLSRSCSRLVLRFGCFDWLSRLVVKIGCQDGSNNWLLRLVVKIVVKIALPSP